MLASAQRIAHAAARRAAATVLFAVATAPALGFGFDDVAQRAEALSRQPYRAPAFVLPAELKALDYDGYRDIRFRPDRSLWRDQKLPFEVQFFHLGKYQTQPVTIHEVSPQGVRRVDFDARDFDYGKNRLSPQRWGTLGLAGFRVHHAFDAGSGYKDELVVFLGASYLRAVGSGQHYGLSARGLAIDTVGAPAGAGEEFPRFTEFWLERPAAGATSVVIHALLESPRATGAYTFTVRPGETTAMEVRARLFVRPGVATLGLAPLTSMFQHGENQPRASDFRPEVHDSDGLSVLAGNGEWLWRPLINPPRPMAASFALEAVRGFGLMQRDRAYRSYEDTEARYEQRPSAWVEPLGEWGPGRVELLQLPTPDETHDNIVAYWVPAKPPVPGRPMDFAYRLSWQGERQARPPSGWTVQSRRGKGFREPAPPPTELQFVIDFDGPSLRAVPADAAVEAVASVGAGARLVESHAYRNPVDGTWRMTLRVDRPSPGQPLELRAFLRRGADALTETWTHLLPSE